MPVRDGSFKIVWISLCRSNRQTVLTQSSLSAPAETTLRTHGIKHGTRKQNKTECEPIDDQWPLDDANETNQPHHDFTGDQGFFLGEHDLMEKRWIYEESMRMPFIVHYPKAVKAYSTNDRLINNTDFAPTILAIAGVDAPDQMQGRGFASASRGVLVQRVLALLVLVLAGQDLHLLEQRTFARHTWTTTPYGLTSRGTRDRMEGHLEKQGSFQPRPVAVAHAGTCIH